MRPRVLSTTPVLQVSDLQRSLDFYTTQLAFGRPSVHGQPPCFAMLFRDGFELMLSVGDPHPNTAGTWDVYLRVMDVDAEQTVLKASGAQIVRGPCDEPYQMREIEVLDPDGYRWCIAQDISGGLPDVWSGTLDTGAQQFRLVLKLWGTEGAIDSLDQNAMGIVVAEVSLNDLGLRFTVPSIGATYEGARAGEVIAGTWSQRGRSWPLAWRR